MNEAFPTIFTSGTILAVAGALIGVMTTNPVIAAIGTCLGRGTVISIVLVMAVLPQILLIGDTIVERTSFDVKFLWICPRQPHGQRQHARQRPGARLCERCDRCRDQGYVERYVECLCYQRHNDRTNKA